MRIDMYPENVHQAGADVGTLGEAAATRITTLFQGNDAAVASHPGWSCTESLINCRTAWETRMRQTLTATTAAGDALTGSATAVAATETEARDRIAEVLRGYGS